MVVVWPDRNIKSSQIFPKVAQRVATTVLLKNDAFQNSQNSFPYIWATFILKFAAENF